MKAMFAAVVLPLAGFAAGVAFVAACGDEGGASLGGLGPGKALAQGNCAQYEVQMFEPDDFVDGFYGGGVPVTLPPGWTPLSGGGGASVITMARCVQ